MNDIIGIIPEFKLTWYQAIGALTIFVIWTRFVMNLVLRLAERVGLIMTSGEMPSPVSTGINDEVNLFTPHKCIKCGYKQDWRTFIPFVMLFRKHENNCEFSYKSKQSSIVITEFVFFLITLSIITILFISKSYMSPIVLIAYALAIPLSLFDMNFHWTPDRFSITFLLLGLLASPFASVDQRIFGSCLLAGMMTFAFLCSGAIRRKDVSSSGDVIMMAGAGAWIGTSHIMTFCISLAIIYGIMALQNLFTAQETESSALPLGPAITGGSIITMISIIL